MRAKDIMTSPVHTVREDTAIDEAAGLIGAHAVTALPVVDVRSMPVLEANAVVGIISRRDILRAMVRSDDVLAREVQHRLDEYAEGERLWTATVRADVARVAGEFADDTEQAIVVVLARTVPGVAAVELEPGGEP